MGTFVSSYGLPFSLLPPLPSHSSESSVPTGPPQDVVANSTDPSTLSISWAAPPEEQQNGLIQIYNISIIEIETMTFFQFITMEESIEIPDLHPYYSYSYSVSAVTEVGEGPYSVVALIRMPEGGNNEKIK